MSAVRRKKAGFRKSASGNKPTRGRSGRQNKDLFVDGILDTWAVRAAQERSKWLSKPRLHTAVFEQARHDEEFEKVLATNKAAFKDKSDAEAFARQKEKRQQEIDTAIRSLGWSLERLKSFIDAVVTYRGDVSIQNYLSIRQKFPEVDIQVAHFGGIDALFSLEADFKNQGINPDLIAGALDGDEPGVDELCLHLLDLLLKRDELPKSGSGFIDRRRKAVSDASVNYLITTILEAYDWNEHVYRVPASLVVLIRHQLCGTQPDLDVEYRLRERKRSVAMGVAQCLNPEERLSINKLKLLAGISRTTAARWLKDQYFQHWLDFGRRQPWEELLSAARQGASKNLHE